MIITADHGGSGRSHGTTKPINWTIPWIVTGHGVRIGKLNDEGILTLDTSATALWLLGSSINSMQGRPIVEAFT